jgi:hypothetical protein
MEGTFRMSTRFAGWSSNLGGVRLAYCGGLVVSESEVSTYLDESNASHSTERQESRPSAF